MKKVIARILAFIFVFAVVIPTSAAFTTPSVVSAATAALTATKKTIAVGANYTVALKDSTNVSKKTFKSSSTKIATVNGKGVVTGKAPGTATITCTVTLKTGGTVKLTCKVTVKKRVPATKITFKNVIHDEINAHVIELGGKYDFNCTMTPSNTNDTTFFTIVDSDIASVTSTGVVTAKKEGITVLEARAGVNATEAKKVTNTVVAKTYILVTKKAVATPIPTATPTPTVTLTPTPTPVMTPEATAASMVSSKEIQITFNTEIDKKTVIDNNGNLIIGAVTITPGFGATPLGMLSAKLSGDMKTLYITTTDEFNGTYVVTVFNKVMTKDGQLVSAKSFQSYFVDTTGPAYVNSEIEDNGYVCRINFNEAIDISNLAIIDVNGTANGAIKSRLTSVASYSLSNDKKSLLVDLSACGEKVINVMVTMIGIKDLKGNDSIDYRQNVIVLSDMTEKPVANIIDTKRESKTLLTVTFDRPMTLAGYANVDGNYMTGVVDAENNRVVHYTLTNTSITGVKPVTFSGYRNYNMVNSTSNSQTRGVDFTLDTTPPNMIAYDMVSEVVNGTTVNRLEIVFNKKIVAVNGSGSLKAFVNSTNGNVYSKDFSYTSSADNQKLILTFHGQVMENGTYIFSVPSGIVVDTLENPSKEQNVTIAKNMGSSTALPQPRAVEQDVSNPSKIKVSFNNKLDITSAQTPSNYILNAAIMPVSATLIEQSENNAVVELTFTSGVFATSGLYTVLIKGIKGYNDSYGTMKDYNSRTTLIENTCPSMLSAKLTSPTIVQLTMNKDVTGSGEFMVYLNGSYVSTSTVYASGKYIIITLPESLASSSLLTISKNDFKDLNQNVADIPAQFIVEKAY